MNDTALILAPNDLGTATLDRWVAMIVRADAAGWPMVLLAAANPADPIDGLALAAFCSGLTQRIGLCASIDPDGVEPFTLARGLATLDHLSIGRAAWRLAGGEPARAAELVGVVRELLTSWGPDALVADREQGVLSDAAAVAAIDHQGAFFAVRGPLNVPRPPQGTAPLLALPGETRPGADLALEESQMLRCSIDEAAALLAYPAVSCGATLRARLGLAA